MIRPGRMRRVSLVQRIGILITMLAVLTVAAAGSSLWFITLARRNVEYMRRAAEQVTLSSQMQLAWLDVVGALDSFSLTSPTAGAKQELDRSLTKLFDRLSALEATGGLGQTPQRAAENQETIASIQATIGEVEALANEIYELSADNRWGTVIDVRQDELAPLQSQLAADLERINRNLTADLEAVDAQVRRSQNAARVLAIAAAILALGLPALMARSGQRNLSRPLEELIGQLKRITQGDYRPVEPLERYDEIGELSKSVALMTDRLRESQEQMEGRVAERTQALRRQSLQVQVAAQVARDIAAARNLEQLLNSAVDLIRERFDYYHAGIFLTDARGEYQILRAATGDAGREMLERKHSLRVGQVGLVGYAAHSGEARVASDVGRDVAHFRNPLLPDTRSEAAIPLKSAGRVIGVLDVQSQEPNAFDAESLNILQVLADQLAIAIQNARLLEEIQKNLSDLQSAYGQLERQAWLRFLETTPTLGYAYDGVDVTPLEGSAPSAAAHPEEGRPVSIPLRVRGEEIGSLDVWPRAGRLSEAENYLLATLSSRLSQTMESARLYEETQARAVREETINRLTASISRSLDLDGVLRSAALELGKLPAVREASVVLDPTGGAGLDDGGRPDGESPNDEAPDAGSPSGLAPEDERPAGEPPHEGLPPGPTAQMDDGNHRSEPTAPDGDSQGLVSPPGEDTPDERMNGGGNGHRA